MADRKEQLRTLMRDNRLSVCEVAAITMRSQKTVRVWRCQSGVAPPEHMLRLIEAHLKNV